MFLTVEDLADKIVSRHWEQLRCDNMELVGEANSFGHILVDNRCKLRILIVDEEEILRVMEEFMVNAKRLLKEALERYWQLRNMEE